MPQGLNKEELKTALAALLFAVADSDGRVSQEELDAIRGELLGGEDSEAAASPPCARAGLAQSFLRSQVELAWRTERPQ